MHLAAPGRCARPCSSSMGHPAAAAARPSAASTPITISSSSSSRAVGSSRWSRQSATQRCRVAQGDATSAMEQQHQHHQQQHSDQLQQHHAAGQSHQQLTGRVARFAAAKHARAPVVEQARPLAEYMALPASQYSVLDARRIERLDDTTFRCFVGRLAFLGFSVEPVITVSVVVEERGCTIRLLSAELQGSPAVQDINARFTARMTNVVRWHEAAAAGAGAAAADGEDSAGAAGSSSSASSGSSSSSSSGLKEISSDTSIEVVVVVPAWAGFLPVASIEAAGSSVMATTLNLMVPRFLQQLQTDYRVWAAGDESRKPVGDLGGE